MNLIDVFGRVSKGHPHFPITHHRRFCSLCVYMWNETANTKYAAHPDAVVEGCAAMKPASGFMAAKMTLQSSRGGEQECGVIPLARRQQA
jgi:hypothetical protein